MNVLVAFEEIIQYSHMWNWAPDWQMAKYVYEEFPNSHSVLTPFAYTYLEELIRTTTSEYGRVIYDENLNPKKRRVGSKLIKLAIQENSNPEFILLLGKIKKYYHLHSLEWMKVIIEIVFLMDICILDIGIKNRLNN
jgi:hypothetical protein